jgi:hypothetical protein
MYTFDIVNLWVKPPNEEGVYHAFPIDENGKQDTARDWSSYRAVDGWEDGKCFPVRNRGFSNVRIIDLEKRGNGGRAYQVILTLNNNQFRVDLRENALMDVINNTGIQAGGRLNGTFCFVKDGSHINLVLEGSDTHKAALKEQERRSKISTKAIKKADLKPGYVYSSLGGEKKIFLGFVYSPTINRTSFEIGKPTKLMVFADYSSSGRGVINPLDTEDCYISLYVDFKKTHSFKLEEGKYSGDWDLDITLHRYKKNSQEIFDRMLSEPGYGDFIRRAKELIGAYELMHTHVKREDVKPSQDFLNECLQKLRNKYYRW